LDRIRTRFVLDGATSAHPRGTELKYMVRSIKRKKRSSFTARQGIFLSLSIGALVALIFVLVYYVYVLPMQKSLE
jgi:hypothetical protein